MKAVTLKKQHIRFIAFFMMIFLVVTPLTACSQDMTVKSEGMEITLSKEYQQSTLANATWYYNSPDGIALGIKSMKNDVEKSGLEADSAQDYAEAYIKANNIPGKPKVKNKGKYVYFEYSHEVSGTDYSYLTCIYDNDDAYWLVSFACYKALYSEYKSDFFKSADSVVFDE